MSHKTSPVVDFVVVGPGKSGTTWLYGLMKAHPEICESAVKETMFFEDRYRSGSEWYENLFRRTPDHRTAGEISNTYIANPVVPERIRAYNPGMKIVVTVRNPVERAISHYLWQLRSGLSLGPFSSAVWSSEHRILLERGMFWKMLQPYLRTFGEKQIQVLVFEDLKRSETSYAQSFLRFVGVTPTVPQVDSDTFKLEAAAPRVKLLATLLRAGAEAARVIGQPILVQKVKESLVPRLAYRRLRPDERPALTETERLRLESHFAADVKSLSSFIGRDLYAEWFGKARSPEIPTLQPVPGS